MDVAYDETHNNNNKKRDIIHPCPYSRKKYQSGLKDCTIMTLSHKARVGELVKARHVKAKRNGGNSITSGLTAAQVDYQGPPTKRRRVWPTLMSKPSRAKRRTSRSYLPMLRCLSKVLYNRGFIENENQCKTVKHSF